MIFKKTEFFEGFDFMLFSTLLINALDFNDSL